MKRLPASVMLLVLMFCVVRCQADNLLVNAGFEKGLDGWRVAHAGGDDPTAGYTAVVEAPHGGELCVRYHKTDTANHNNHLDQIVTVEPGKQYTVSAWVKSDGGLDPMLSVEGMKWQPIAEVRCGSSTEWHSGAVTFGSGDEGQVRIIWYGGSKGRRYEGYGGTSWLDDVEVRPATPDEVERLEERRRTNTADWLELNLRWDDTDPTSWFPTEGLLDPPAGKHGFAEVRDGHLHFADGMRGRFWGVCLCGRAAFPTHVQADIIAARLAKWGVNMIRLHALEVQIFDDQFDDTRHLSAEMLDRLDYFVAQLKKRGIYIFLDWRTAWRTKKGDGLAPHWLYHWAMLDDRFVDLNQNYARMLYLHKNPYTGNRFVDEPAVAVVEIVNEKDIFSVFTGKEKDDPDTGRLKEALKHRWNKWLVKRYTDRTGLAQEWTNAAGMCGLRAGEDPAKGNVEMPLPAHALGAWDRDYAATTGTARASDALVFLCEIQTDYFRRMRDFLRELGVKVPISGTNWHMQIRPNGKSNAQMDFTENHSYWTHADPWGPGRKKYTRTRNIPMIRQDPTVGDINMISRLNDGAVPGKPFIVSEWNFDSPNEYRCEGPIEMAAYGALQDWDGIICYCYYGNWGDSWDKVEEGQSLGMFLGSEEIYNDPAIFCQFPIASAIFRRGDVEAAKRTVHIGYSHVDTFFAAGKWGNETAQFAFLPFLHRVRHSYFEKEYEGDADVVISSGLSVSGSYAKAKRAILFADNPFVDLQSKQIGREQLVAGLYTQVKFADAAKAKVSFSDFIPSWSNIEAPLAPGIEMRTLPTGAKAIGIDGGGKLCLGFIDGKRCVAPGASVLSDVDTRWFYRLFAAAMGRWGLGGTDPADEQPTLRSDTGQLAWAFRGGVLTISTPNTQGAVGFLGGQEIKLASIAVAARTEYCSVMLTSLDGKPIAESGRLLLTALARCENTGQVWADDRRTIPAEGRGHGPVLVEPVDADMVITTNAGRAAVHSLDAAGKPKGAVAAQVREGRIKVQLRKEHAAVHYGIEIPREP